MLCTFTCKPTCWFPYRLTPPLVLSTSDVCLYRDVYATFNHFACCFTQQTRHNVNIIHPVILVTNVFTTRWRAIQHYVNPRTNYFAITLSIVADQKPWPRGLNQGPGRDGLVLRLDTGHTETMFVLMNIDIDAGFIHNHLLSL
mgnify:FL=1